MPRTSSSRFVRSLETQPARRFLEVPAHALHKAPALPLERKLAAAAFPLDEPADGLRTGPGLLPCQLLSGEDWLSLPSPRNPIQEQEAYRLNSCPCDLTLSEPPSSLPLHRAVSSHGSVYHTRRAEAGLCLPIPSSGPQQQRETAGIPFPLGADPLSRALSGLL